MKRISLATLVIFSSFFFQIDYYFTSMMAFIGLMLIMFMPEKVNAKEFGTKAILPVIAFPSAAIISGYYLPISMTNSLIIMAFALLMYIDRLYVTPAPRRFEYYALPLVVLGQLLYFDETFPESRYLFPILGFFVSIWLILCYSLTKKSSNTIEARIYSINLYISTLFHTIFVLIYMQYGSVLNGALQDKAKAWVTTCDVNYEFCDRYQSLLAGSYFKDQWDQSIYEHYAWSITFMSLMTFLLTSYIALRHERLNASSRRPVSDHQHP